METMSDDILLEELKKRFRETKKALHDLSIINEKMEKLNIKLAESERLKSDFLSNVRNEINNPLASILGIAGQLMGPVDEEAKERMAEMIYNEAFELDFQLKNIFMAAEIEAGEAVMKIARVDIPGLIQNLVRLFAGKARKKAVTVEVAAGCDNREFLFKTDPEKIHCMLANLLANAIEFNHRGKKVLIDAHQEGKMLIITVADEGIGIPEAERERLFERFRQVEGGSKKKHRGQGLGLSITKALIEMLGGTISFSSVRGCIFRLAVPEAELTTEDFADKGNEFLFETGTVY